MEQELSLVTVRYEGRSLDVYLPPVFATLADILPISFQLFGQEKTGFVDSRDLHSSLDVSRNHATWLKAEIKKHDLVENRDYVVERMELDINDPDAMSEFHANNNSRIRSVQFTSFSATKIAALTRSPVGNKILEYMIHVTDAAHDAVVKKYLELIEEKQRLLEGEKLANQRITARSEDLAKALGFSSPVLARNHAQQVKALQSQVDKLSMAGAACEGYSRALTRAAAHLKSKKLAPDEFIQELFEVDNRMKDGDVGYVPYF